jgi:hypothetical protein
MNAMSQIHNKTPRSKETPPGTPEKLKSPSRGLRKRTESPRLREQSGKPEHTLLSPSARQAGCIPPASPRATQPATVGPYQSPSSITGAPASNEPASPRAYLKALKPDNLANGILRDQTSANVGNYPTAWISLVQASLEEPVGQLVALAARVLAAMPEHELDRLYPPVGANEDFDWKPFGALCDSLWPHFSRQVISLESLPPRTLGLLAEFHGELACLPSFSRLQPKGRDKAVSDALFNLLIWNGIFSPLTKTVPEQYQRLVNGLCAYVKAAWGMQAQSQGRIGQTIASMVPAENAEKCAAFRTVLARQVERLAALRTLKFHDKHLDQRLNHLREKNIDRHFTDTWLARTDDYVQVVRQGIYYLTDADGVERKCKSYRELSDYVGSGTKGSLPQVVLHVAGDRIKNFLCTTYLYDAEKPLFTDSNGLRVDPVAMALQTRFTLSRDYNGVVSVRFSCIDHAVEHAMLVEPDEEGPGVDAHPLFQGSLEFHGEMHFHQNEEFEAGNVLVTGQNLHMFQ